MIPVIRMGRATQTVFIYLRVAKKRAKRSSSLCQYRYPTISSKSHSQALRANRRALGCRKKSTGYPIGRDMPSALEENPDVRDRQWQQRALKWGPEEHPCLWGDIPKSGQ